jgi:hypothetical protein
MSESQMLSSESKSKSASDKLEEEIQKVQEALRRQNDRISQLQDVLQKCRGKSGLPPLIPLCQRVDPSELRHSQTGQPAPKQNPKFMRPAKEMPELNQYCTPTGIHCGVETIYKGNITPELKKSSSFTRASLENIDRMSLYETEKMFGAEEMGDDADISEYLDADDNAAADSLRETVRLFFPGDEEQEEFMHYMEEAEMDGASIIL